MNKFNIKFDFFGNIFNKITDEPEFTISFIDKASKYMIIKYDGYVTFQKCSCDLEGGEIRYNNLLELYKSKTIDDICLKEDWEKIDDIMINDYLSFKDNLNYIIKKFQL